MKKFFSKTSYIILVSIIFLICILFIYSFVLGQSVPENQELINISFNGKYSKDGISWQPLGATNNPVENGLNKVYIKGHFNKDIPINEILWFREEHIGIKMSINGEEVFSSNQPGSFPSMFNSPGYSWHGFSSPGITFADEILLEVTAYYGESTKAVSHLLSSIYMGDGSGLYQLLFTQIDIIAVMLMISMAAGIVYLLEGAIDHLKGLKEAGRIALLGFYCFSGSMYCLFDAIYPYFSLLIFPSWLAAVMDISGILLFAVSLVLLVNQYVSRKIPKKIIGITAVITIGSVLVFLILQLASIADLYELQLYMCIMAIIALILGLTSLVLEFKQNRNSDLWILLLAITPVFVAIVVDCINLVSPFMPRRAIMKYCFAISMVLMVWHLVKHAIQEAKTRERVQKMKEEILESRISIMISQIQPHFLFNTLTSIRYLCSTDPKKAEDVISQFASFLRGNIDSLTSSTPIPFEREYAHLEHYLAIEKIRFSDTLNIETDIKARNFLLPPLTIQPIVENAIRHGVNMKKGGGTVKISTWETPKAYYICVKDDGKGFDTEKMHSDGIAHLGIENVRTRLKFHNNGDIAITSAIDVGTTVILTISKGELKQ